MTDRLEPDRRRGAVLHVVGDRADTGRTSTAARVAPTRQWRGPSGPPRRADDRRWKTDGGHRDG